MEKWKNPVKARLEAGEFVVGATITTNNVEVPALVAKLGFHFLWCEMEHSPLTLENLRNIVLASRALPAAVFARVPLVDLWTAKRVLDQGVSGVIFPFASTPDLAKRVAAACHYPPLGKRGSGAGLAIETWPEPANYYDSADSNILTILVIEEAAAVDQIDAIAATPGIDVLFIGVSDLSFSLGLRGRQNEPQLTAAVDKIIAAAKKHGKFLGRPGANAKAIEEYRQQGFQFFQAPTELGLIRAGARQFLEPLGIEPPKTETRALY